MKKLIIIPTTLLLNACSHAPEPAQAKGGWYELNTTIEQVRADTYYNGVILQQPVSQPNSTVQYSNDNYLKKEAINVTPAPRIAETVKPRSEQSATAPKNQGSNNSFLKPTTNSITSSGEIKTAAKGATKQHSEQPALSPAKPISSNNYQAQTAQKTDQQTKPRPEQPPLMSKSGFLKKNANNAVPATTLTGPSTPEKQIYFVRHDGKGSLQKALKEIVPSDWTAEISPEVTKTFRRTISWQGNDQWPYVLDKMLRNYGLTVIKNTEKRHLLIDFQQQKGKTSQKAPVSPDKTPASPVRTPVSSDKLPQKSLTPVTVPQKQTEKLTWNLKKGSTLRDGLTEWASSSPCGNSTWNLVWDTPVNYRIDAPLIFRGNFESALKDTLMLYLSADKPLYAFRNIAQCVITIKDTQQE
ncbi:TPA: toxin co-regulated pilus biosynthesis Q family protein [Escherichia coli]|uniref:Pilus assembly protein n=4 Tax=Enterobacteriaceae TaxID=543 RepID=A0AAX2T667_ECOLX|nr:MULTISPECIES: TcpQ domain-containing protein [Enterobacteriaceae]EAB2900122.1 pilus assembly protein [Salmonella enterica]EBG8071394.1 pilus assembly protein [Salmonella enterica subsp. enterica serovar Elisabethville]EBL5696528.1 pilus assembly protein [Salmonella enterica subsp. enterica serovar Typhimurium]EBQ6103679.1 pilus assembly protein [Salmonella enterica subsp. enterica serovar Ibadan]EBQ8889249.1 pilus assembly protein [Salmonella enterica subsp. enterica serovar Montevideo]EBW